MKISTKGRYALRMMLDLAINDKDLTGEPEAGRRFKGSIWLQGRLDK